MSSINLFIKIFFINTFTFGGGYTIIPIIQKTFVDELELIEKKEMDNIVALANSVPGVMAISTSFLVGYKIKGIKGAIVSLMAAIIPCIVIISLIFNIYTQIINNEMVKEIMLGIGVSVGAALLGASIKMLLNLVKDNKKYVLLFIYILTFLMYYIFGVHIALILIIASILGSGII